MFDTLIFAHSLDTHYSSRSFAAHAPHTRLRDSSADTPYSRPKLLPHGLHHESPSRRLPAHNLLLDFLQCPRQ